MRNDVAVVVLAGGLGSRIGGGKPLRPLAGEALIERALVLARSYSDLVAIAVRDPAQVAGVDALLLQDDAAEGPIGGLAAAVQFASAQERQLMLTIPADMPFLPPELADRLAGAIGSSDCALAAGGGQTHPVCGLWRTRIRDLLPEYLGMGRRSLRGLAEFAGHRLVDWPGGRYDPFFNINSEEDLTEAERRLAL